MSVLIPVLMKGISVVREADAAQRPQPVCPLRALIKVKEAGLICMADGAHTTLYHGAGGE